MNKHRIVYTLLASADTYLGNFDNMSAAQGLSTTLLEAYLRAASEVTRLKWIGPQEAISQVASGEMLMVPPTLRSLEYIVQFKNTDELFSAVQNLRPFPILPKVVIKDDLRTIVLPWDEAYESLEGEGLSVPDGAEPFGSSRIGERDGGWCSF